MNPDPKTPLSPEGRASCYRASHVALIRAHQGVKKRRAETSSPQLRPSKRGAPASSEPSNEVDENHQPAPAEGLDGLREPCRVKSGPPALHSSGKANPKACRPRVKSNRKPVEPTLERIIATGCRSVAVDSALLPIRRCFQLGAVFPGPIVPRRCIPAQHDPRPNWVARVGAESFLIPLGPTSLPS